MRTLLYSSFILLCSLNGFAQKAAILKNSIAVSPIATFYNYNWSVGIAYERLIDNKGRFGINIPVYHAFVNEEFNVDAGTNNTNWWQLNPGFRYYPVRGKIVNYGVGLSYYYIRGKTEYYGFGYYSGQTQYESWKYTIWQAGPMLNNYAAFNINKHLYAGIEFGIGMNIINKGKQEPIGEVYNRNAEKLMSQTNFQIGYRF